MGFLIMSKFELDSLAYLKNININIERLLELNIKPIDTITVSRLVEMPIVKSIAVSVKPVQRKVKNKPRKRHYGGNTKARPTNLINPANNTVMSQYGSLTDAAGANNITIGAVWYSCNSGRVRNGMLFEYA